jgi:hypothetical protein
MYTLLLVLKFLWFQHVCEVESWCPIELDVLPLGKSKALMEAAEDYTVLVKNSIAFPFFGPKFIRYDLLS